MAPNLCSETRNFRKRLPFDQSRGTGGMWGGRFRSPGKKKKKGLQYIIRIRPFKHVPNKHNTF